jgi:predicted nuclease with TOPRIM domain
MSIQIESDLNEVLKEIKQDLKEIKENINQLKVGQARIEGRIDTLDKKFEGKIDTLDEKVKGIDERVKFNRGVLVSLFLAVLGILARLFSTVGNP